MLSGRGDVDYCAIGLAGFAVLVIFDRADAVAAEVALGGVDFAVGGAGELAAEEALADSGAGLAREVGAVACLGITGHAVAAAGGRVESTLGVAGRQAAAAVAEGGAGGSGEALPVALLGSVDGPVAM
jgi:hypothetical protein